LVIYLAPLPRGFLFGLGTLALRVPKIRFCNIGDEVHRGQVVM
jgi:hypothetical protein